MFTVTITEYNNNVHLSICYASGLVVVSVYCKNLAELNEIVIPILNRI